VIPFIAWQGGGRPPPAAAIPESALFGNRLAYLTDPPLAEADMISITPVTKLLVAATKAKYATSTRSAASLDSSVSQSIHQIGPTSQTELRLEINNWWFLANATEEQINAGALSVEAVLVDDLSGRRARLTFDGSAIGTVPVTAGAARLVSDALLPAAFGLTVFPALSRWRLVVRRTAASGAALPYHGTNQSLTRIGEYEYQYASATSDAATIAAAYLDAAPPLAQFSKDNANAALGQVSGVVRPNSGASPNPVAGGFVLLGRANAATRAYCFVGDSITDGTNDTQSPQPTDTGAGWVGRAMTGADGLPIAAFLKASISGDRAQYRAAVNALSRQALAQATAMILALGTNDIAGGRTAAQLIADLTTLAALGRAQGCAKIVGCTITPKAADATNAAVHSAGFSPGGVRDTVNAWIRASGGVFDQIIDFGALDGTGGLWADAAHQQDGTHPSPAGCIAMADIARPVLAAIAAVALV